MVLQADGGELGVATTCASMALADAGIELYDLVTSCCVGHVGSQVSAFTWFGRLADIGVLTTYNVLRSTEAMRILRRSR